MSFGDGSSSSSLADSVGVKRFVTEDEVQVEKDRVQAEWERVRKPDDPVDAPEEAHDTRTLYDKLQQQKQTKELEFEESMKAKNQFRGLEEEETDFLKFCSDKKDEINKKREEENRTALEEIREAMVNKVVDKTAVDEKKTGVIIKAVGSSATKSQSKLLAGAIKRKSSTNGTDSGSTEKRPRSDGEDDRLSNKTAVIVNIPGLTATTVGILPGIGDYSDSDQSSDAADSDSSADIDTDVYIVKKTVCGQQGQCGHSH